MVLENFPVGTLARYGLDFVNLSSLNHGSSTCHARFGQSGPYAQKKGYDTVFQAMGGIMSLTGERGGGPVKPGCPSPTSLRDFGSRSRFSLRSLGASVRQGCSVDFSMLDGQVSLLTLAAARYFALNEVPPRLGTEHPGRVPSATFRSRTASTHITASDQHWAPLCRALGVETWGTAFADNATRVETRRSDERALGANRQAHACRAHREAG